MVSRIQPVKLHDCIIHGPDSGAELFIVEGDSASKTVARVRDSRFQAVLPMQGKPLNALKASKRSVDQNELFAVLVDSLGAGRDETFDAASMRYSNVILLFDPDADGIHCGALMLMYFYQWMRPILETGHLFVVQAPLYEITSPQYSDSVHAFSDEHYRAIGDTLRDKQIEFNGHRFRGLASMSDHALSKTCLDPDTRRIHQLSVEDAESAIATFGSSRFD